MAISLYPSEKDDYIVLSNDDDKLIYAFAGNDTVFSGSGNDTIVGGRGADSMIGASGDDFYYVDHSQDQAIELVGGGSDTVISTVTYSAGLNEIEYIIGGPSSTGLRLTGNNFTRSITGTSGHDVLSDGGYDDAFVTMMGGDGADTYIVSSLNTVVTDSLGFDTVKTSLNAYTLPSGIEALRYTGDGSFEAWGNDLRNAIYGGQNNDKMHAGFGDLLFGLGGDDSYYFDQYGAQVYEESNGGYDTIYASINYVSAAKYVEALIFTGTGSFYGIAGYSTGIAITGGAWSDTLMGRDGNDALRGGDGGDFLMGQGGADKFIFDALWSAPDRLVDFKHGTDQIVIHSAGFGGVTSFGESPSGPMIGFDPGYIGFEPGNHNGPFGAFRPLSLYYDADGGDHSNAVVIAYLDAGTVVTASDILFI